MNAYNQPQAVNLPRCGARTRAGCPCKGPAMRNGRCRTHGGATPRHTEDAKSRIAAARSTKGGSRDKEMRAWYERTARLLRGMRITTTASRAGLKLHQLAPLLRDLLGGGTAHASPWDEARFAVEAIWAMPLSPAEVRLLILRIRMAADRAKVAGGAILCAQTPIQPDAPASAPSAAAIPPTPRQPKMRFFAHRRPYALNRLPSPGHQLKTGFGSHPRAGRCRSPPAHPHPRRTGAIATAPAVRHR